MAQQGSSYPGQPNVSSVQGTAIKQSGQKAAQSGSYSLLDQILGQAPTSPFAAQVLSEPSLVRFFRFGEPAAPFMDHRGLASTASPNVTPAGAASSVFGDAADAAVLIPNNTGGTNKAYVTFGAPGVTNTTPWSVEVVAWHNGYTPQPSIDYGCFIQLSSASSIRILFQSYAFSGHSGPQILAQAGGQSIFSTGTYQYLTQGTKYHVVMTYDGSGNLALYINGTAAGTVAGAAPAAINGIWVGVLDDLLTYPLNGGVDELALYSSALDATTINNHYLLWSSGALLTTYSKTGGGVSAGLAGGAKVVTTSTQKTGGGVSGSVAGAAKTVTFAKTGGGVSSAVAGTPFGRRTSSAYERYLLTEASIVHFWRFGEASAPFNDEVGTLDSTTSPNVSPGAATSVFGDNVDKAVGIPNVAALTNLAYVQFGSPGITSTGAWSAEIIGKNNGYASGAGIDYGTLFNLSDVNNIRILFHAFTHFGNSGPLALAQIGAGSVFSDETKIVLTQGNNYHFVLTYDGAGGFKFYVNGILMGSASGVTPPVMNGIWLGVLDNLTTYPLNGAIDEFALFNAELSGAAVLTHYNYWASGADVTTYSKSGGGISAGLSGAAKVIAYVKAGGGISPSVTGGVRTTRFIKTGGGVSVGLTGAAKVFNYIKTGGGISPGFAGAPKVLRYVKTGGGLSAGLTGATRVTLFIKTGGGLSAALSGTAKRVTFSKTAGGISAGFAGGTKIFNYVKTGGGISAGLTGATRITRNVKTGGGLSSGLAGTAKFVTTLKTGGGISAGFAGAPKVTVRVKTGGGLSSGIAGTAKTVTTAKTGGGVTSAIAGGTQINFIIKTGGGISSAVTGGSKTNNKPKSGGAASSAVAGASKLQSNIKVGGGISSAITGGVRATRIAKTAGAISSAVSGASQTSRRVKTGGAIGAAVAGGLQVNRVY
jgi:hypothetical protein